MGTGLMDLRFTKEGVRVVRYTAMICTSILFAFAAGASSQTAGQSIEWRSAPATLDRFEKRLQEQAVEYGSYALGIPRMAMSDIAYPKSVDEFDQLDGNAILAVAGLAHEQNMLPLKRVYVSFNGHQIDLILVRAVLSKRTTVDDKISKVFGQYRVDAVYLLPVYVCSGRSTVHALFSNDTRGPLLFSGFDGPVPAAISSLPRREPTGKGPSKSALETFLAREYPAFIEKP